MLYIIINVKQFLERKYNISPYTSQIQTDLASQIDSSSYKWVFGSQFPIKQIRNERIWV